MMRAVARTTIDDLLADAQRRLTRLDPAQALQAMCAGAALIDIRSDSQIARDGIIAGALVIPRNVLEWRLDPASKHRHPCAPHLDEHVILLCNDGYQSSLAAATLQHLGWLLLARVDGKSPAEYLGQGELPDRVRRFARRLIVSPPASVAEVFQRL